MPCTRRGLLGAKVMVLGAHTLTSPSIIKREVKVPRTPAPAIYISIKGPLAASVLAISCKNAPVRVGGAGDNDSYANGKWRLRFALLPGS